MTEKFEIKPKNKKHFKKLLRFAKQILGICKSLKLTPIVYGGLAYLYYTKDESFPVRDLDFLVSESTFTDLIKLLDKQKNLTHKKMPYHSIEVFSDDLEIDLDSMEHFLGSRSKDIHKVQIERIELSILNIEALIDIYEKALEEMPQIRKLDEKRKNYTKKLENLKQSNRF